MAGLIQEVKMLNGIERTLGRLEEKIDGIGETLKDYHKQTDKNDKRLTSLEATRNRQYGASKVLAGLISLVAVVFGWIRFS